MFLSLYLKKLSVRLFFEMNTLLDAVYLATILDPGLPDHIIYHLDVIIDGSETTPQ